MKLKKSKMGEARLLRFPSNFVIGVLQRSGSLSCLSLEEPMNIMI